MNLDAVMQKEHYKRTLQEMTDRDLTFKALAYIVASVGAKTDDPLLSELHRRGSAYFSPCLPY